MAGALEAGANTAKIGPFTLTAQPGAGAGAGGAGAAASSTQATSPTDALAGTLTSLLRQATISQGKPAHTFPAGPPEEMGTKVQAAVDDSPATADAVYEAATKAAASGEDMEAAVAAARAKAGAGTATGAPAKKAPARVESEEERAARAARAAKASKNPRGEELEPVGTLSHSGQVRAAAASHPVSGALLHVLDRLSGRED